MVMLQLTSQSETGDIFGIEAIMLFGNKIVIYSTRTENNLKWEIYREGKGARGWSQRARSNRPSKLKTTSHNLL